ncbi:zinc finger protein 799-like [Folsomia candida]|uniref:zinc finger protein 799-like n=1 Tax=Folsomia candida TaxID=158441 RepID=UPI000B8FBE88|nr:zinc finger protein 799-like [Folsomia candida]
MDLKPGMNRECPKSSKTLTTSPLDLTKQASDTKVKCEICNKSPSALRTHMANERPKCDIAPQMCFSTTNITNNTKPDHSTEERSRFPCTSPGCEKTYLNKQHVSRHVKIDHAENPVRFPCTLCGKKFKRRDQLKSHVPIHTTEKPHKCATCGMSFRHLGNLKSHEKAFSG